MWHTFEILAVIVFTVTGSGFIAHGVYVLVNTLSSYVCAIFLTLCELIKWVWFTARVLAGFYMVMKFLTLLWEDFFHLPSLKPLLELIVPEWLQVPEEAGHGPVFQPPPPTFRIQGPPNSAIYSPTTRPADNPLLTPPIRRMRCLSTSDFGNIYVNGVTPSSQSSYQFPTYNDIHGHSVPRPRRIHWPHVRQRRRHPFAQSPVSFLNQDERAGGDRPTF